MTDTPKEQEVYSMFADEKRLWMFWLARIFGVKRGKNFYYWRGKYWVTGDLND
jgi:hypothetical protein